MKVKEAKAILFKYYKEQSKKMIDNNFSKKDLDFLKVKFKHSFECYHIVKKVIENDEIFINESDSFKEKAEIACLLHDIGRFFELTNELNQKEHGLFGADLVRYNENLTEKPILIAIKHHDQADIVLDNDIDYKSLSENEKKETLTLLKLLRDVDKIANLNLFKRRNTIFTRKDKKYGFSPEYFDAIKNKHRIDKKYKNTVFDSIAYYIIWFHELEFNGSEKFVLKNKLIDHLVKMYEFYINDLEKSELSYSTREEVLNKKVEMQNNLNRIKSILVEQKVV